MKTAAFRNSPLFRSIVYIILFAFSPMLPVNISYAQVAIVMPPVGQMVHTTRYFEPPQMVGLQVDLKDPFSFNFIMDQGQSPMPDDVKKEEFNKIIKYFLVSLAMPNKDMWVNLSPYESSRIIPPVFAQTEMGRDLLAQDYILKQFTASLMYPEDGLGKKFWSKVYAEAQTRFGTTEISVNTFNKVWIMADHADIYQKGNTAYLINSHLKVMLEQDYMAIEKNKEMFGTPQPVKTDEATTAQTKMASDIVRQIIIPAIEKEVNEGQSFASVRQVYNAEIMATWFKRTLRQSLLGQVFADKSKIAGQKHNDPKIMDNIYHKYLRAYKKGVFNYIREDAAPDGQMIPRKYFSGGFQNLPEYPVPGEVDPIKILTPAMLGNPAMKALLTKFVNWARGKRERLSLALANLRQTKEAPLVEEPVVSPQTKAPVPGKAAAIESPPAVESPSLERPVSKKNEEINLAISDTIEGARIAHQDKKHEEELAKIIAHRVEWQKFADLIIDYERQAINGKPIPEEWKVFIAEDIETFKGWIAYYADYKTRLENLLKLPGNENDPKIKNLLLEVDYLLKNIEAFIEIYQGYKESSINPPAMPPAQPQPKLLEPRTPVKKGLVKSRKSIFSKSIVSYIKDYFGGVKGAEKFIKGKEVNIKDLNPKMPVPTIGLVKKLALRVKEIKGIAVQLDKDFEPLSDDDVRARLQAKTKEFRNRLDKALDAKRQKLADVQAQYDTAGTDNERLALGLELDRLKIELHDEKERVLDEMTNEAFAYVRAAAGRFLKMPHFDVQLLGGMVLNLGAVAQMKTGEGKTLVAILSVYLNALTGEGVHVVTSNDFLAKRDADFTRPVYNALGLSVDALQHGMTRERRAEAYLCDVTYGTGGGLRFDYLTDNLRNPGEEPVQRGHNYALIDEVDSELIDDAGTPYIISGEAEGNLEDYRIAKEIADHLQGALVSEDERTSAQPEVDLSNGQDYWGDEKNKTVTLTEKGMRKIETLLGIGNVSRGKLLAIPAIRNNPNWSLNPESKNSVWEQVAPGVVRLKLKINLKEGDVRDTAANDLKKDDVNNIAQEDYGVIWSLLQEAQHNLEDSGYYRLILTLVPNALRFKPFKYRRENGKLEDISSQSPEALFSVDRDFVVSKELNQNTGKLEWQVVLIDRGTGYKKIGTRWNGGLHQAAEAYMGVEIKPENQTIATITTQNYFRLYNKLSGMSGTALPAAKELFDLFNMEVIEVPTNETVKRIEDPDTIFENRQEKFNAVVEEIMATHFKEHSIEGQLIKGQPILAVTGSVEDSEFLYKLLLEKGFKPNEIEVLNAKNPEREDGIIKKAGLRGAITIATNMAGRGTDIKLGGGDANERKVIDAMGGLCVFGTERQESRRIDEQLSGRNSRQGDKGRTKFFLSKDDKLIRMFIDRKNSLAGRIPVDGYSGPELNFMVRKFQEQAEKRNFEMRKRALEFDNVIGRQREIVYSLRSSCLAGEDVSNDVLTAINGTVEALVDKHFSLFPDKKDNEKLLESLAQDLKLNFNINIDGALRALKGLNNEQLKINLENLLTSEYTTMKVNSEYERKTLLKIIDARWKQHLFDLDSLKDGIYLRTMAQRDPVAEFNKDALDLFQGMYSGFNQDVVAAIFGNPKLDLPADKTGQPELANKAALAPVLKPSFVHREGGINLSDSNLTINIKVDGLGMPLPVQYQDKVMLNLKGLTSIIRRITPVTPENSPNLYELMNNVSN